MTTCSVCLCRRCERAHEPRDHRPVGAVCPACYAAELVAREGEGEGPTDPGADCCPHCAKPWDDWSQLGCVYCDSRYSDLSDL